MNKDSKARFQQPTFKSRLVEARGYKRPHREAQQDTKSVWEAVGLGSPWAKSLAVLGIVALAGLIYWPSFFFVTTVEVSGDDSLTEDVKQLTRQYFQNHKLTAQQNIFLLSKKGLASELKAGNRRIRNVKIKKNFFRSLAITIDTRKETYTLEVPENMYILSDDGYILKEHAATTTGLTLLRAQSLNHLSWHEAVISGATLQNVQTYRSEMPDRAGTELDFVEFNVVPPSTMRIHTVSGFVVMVEPESEASKILSKVSLVLQRLDPEQKNKLAYIDLRLSEKAFVCLKNTPCAVETAPISTTTEASTVIPIP